MEASWYIITARTGHEGRVADMIRETAKSKNLLSHIEDIIVPSEEVIMAQRGKKVQKTRKLFPGYVLIHAEMTDDVWHLCSKTPHVSGFLGGKGKPQPIPKREIEQIFKRMQEEPTDDHSSMSFEVGETVKVIDGPFDSFSAIVEGVDPSKTKLKVAVSIFGRATPVELDYTQVEKI